MLDYRILYDFVILYPLFFTVEGLEVGIISGSKAPTPGPVITVNVVILNFFSRLSKAQHLIICFGGWFYVVCSPHRGFLSGVKPLEWKFREARSLCCMLGQSSYGGETIPNLQTNPWNLTSRIHSPGKRDSMILRVVYRHPETWSISIFIFFETHWQYIDPWS